MDEIMCGFINASQLCMAKLNKPSGVPCNLFISLTNYRNAQNYQTAYKNK